MRSYFKLLAACTLLALPFSVYAQGTQIALGGLAMDATLPVEVTAEQLEVNQETGSAVFTGEVVVVQGDMRLAAGILVVEYDAEQQTGISRMTASNGVTVANGPDAASARDAVYDLASSRLTMTGDVVLTQGPTTISGDSFAVDLTTGAGRMEGRVRTVFQTQDN